MTAITDHESFPQPVNPDGMLWRYLDLPKLVSLLARSELYLTQLASLDDPLEGRYPPSVRQEMVDCWQTEVAAKHNIHISPGYPADTQESLMRASLYVNCWCLQDHESEAMWRIYGGTSGVAVRTQYRNLAHALPPDVYIGQVQYIEPDERQFPFQNALDLAMFKRHFFKHEAECRVVKWSIRERPDNKNLVDTDFERYPAGEWIPVKIREAITDVMVSPLAPDWFHECVNFVVDRFSKGLPVVKSTMRP